VSNTPRPGRVLVCRDAAWHGCQRFPSGYLDHSAQLGDHRPRSTGNSLFVSFEERPQFAGLAGASRRNRWARCCRWLGARALASQAPSTAERASLTATPPGLLRSRPRPQQATAVVVRVRQGTYGSSWRPGQANQDPVRRRADAAARPPAARSPGRGQHPARPAGGPAAGRYAGPHPAARAGPGGASAAGTAPQRPGQR
jgi:hypothetical protein